MCRKLTFEEVRNYINGKEGNGCKLLSEVYEGNKKPLLIQCHCGEEFITTFTNFKNGQKQCKECGHEKQRIDIETIKSYINGEKGNGCKLLSTEYKNSSTKLKIQCACGEVFENTFNHFKSKKQKQCPKCSNEKIHEKQKKQVKFNCEYCGKECSVKKSNFEGKEHHFCSRECQGKWQSELWSNEEYRSQFCGENSVHWSKDKTPEEREMQRCYPEYTQFTNNVFKRDNYTCQCCGQYGGSLNAHHLNSYHWDKEHRTDINNGVVLCEKCHKEFHEIYGKRNNTIAQFREFLFNKYTQTHDLKFLALIENIDLTTRAF